MVREAEPFIEAVLKIVLSDINALREGHMHIDC